MMLTFELSAIDLILAIAVVILLILHINKMEPNHPDQTSFLKKIKKIAQPSKPRTQIQNDYAECPRGFGKIKKMGEDNTVSERCLGCYRIMECYEQNQ